LTNYDANKGSSFVMTAPKKFNRNIWRRKFNIAKKKLQDDQRQIILGTILGNGFICKGLKSCYFCMRHSVRHLPWLESKAAELHMYDSPTPWYKHGTTCTWRSCSDPIFNELHDFCYPNGKKTVSMEWLDQLRDIGIAVWYGDSGCLTGRCFRNACLRTQYFNLEGNEIISRYFNEVGIPCNINKSRQSYVIVFSVEGTVALFRLIGQCLPKNRYFKLAAGVTSR
jgi:LAGLIDADG DNA endonuclease family